jgi:DNA replication protein DnaC
MATAARTEAASPQSNETNSGAPQPVKLDPWLGFNAYNGLLQNARRRVVDFANGKHLGLVLAGAPGCGKTHLARVVRTYYGTSAYMVSEPSFIAAVQQSYDGEGSEKQVLGRLQNVEVLILDDVGTAHVRRESRSWLEALYWRILDKRFERKAPVLITTNLELEPLMSWIGQRAASRLAGLMGGHDNFVSLFGIADYRMRGW